VAPLYDERALHSEHLMLTPAANANTKLVQPQPIVLFYECQRATGRPTDWEPIRENDHVKMIDWKAKLAAGCLRPRLTIKPRINLVMLRVFACGFVPRSFSII
jgi:hypothetical protein